MAKDLANSTPKNLKLKKSSGPIEQVEYLFTLYFYFGQVQPSSH